VESNTEIRGPAPILVATMVTLALYYQEAALLLSKVVEVFNGVFDTSVPAYPLAGMLFVLIFLIIRRRELFLLLSDNEGDLVARAAGLAIALIPLATLLGTGTALTGSYSFAGLALVCSWAGFAVAARPSLFGLLWPYLIMYLVAIGLVGVLTDAFGDPLALAVASISRAFTWAFGLPVQWSSVYISFIAAGGQSERLVITQECSGVASMSVFVLLTGLMHLDVRPKLWESAAFALGGSLLFLLLNSLRVVVLIVAGLDSGLGMLSNLHGWVGYLFYVVGYSLVIALYFRRVRPRTD
jgi:exosortase/archaeosortase family protein